MSQAATPLAVRVARKAAEADDICSLELTAIAGKLPPFTAGAHLDVRLPNGLVRQYSLCNAPSDSDRYLIAVLRDAASRGGSQAVHDSVREGDALQISEPKNHFPLAPHATHHLLLAGGIGITPLLAMAEQLHAQGAAFTLHYCSRTPQRTAFVQRLANAAFSAHVHHHYDRANQPGVDLAALLRHTAPDTHLYVCGPQGFMEAALTTARAQGWPDSHVHSEFFGATLAPHAADGPFEVELASSGRVIAVAAEKTALQTLLDAGIDVPMSCEQGVCGTCLTPVLRGVPDHRDHYLTPDEQAANDQFLPCCSRSKTPRLVLDL